jgi:Mrp family chromosome partitioning ATPase
MGTLGVSGEVQPATNPSWNRSPSLVRALWRYRWAVIAFALVSAMVGYVYTSVRPPVYEAAGQVMLTSPHDRTLFRNERGVPFVEVERYLDTEADRMASPDVLAGAAELLEGRLRPREIRELIEVQSATTGYAVTVRASSEDRTEAADVVNAVIQAYQNAVTAKMQAQVEASVAQLDELSAQLRQRLAALAEAGDAPAGAEDERTRLGEELVDLQTMAGEIRVDAAVYGAGIEHIEPAAAPETPVSETPRHMAVIFGLLGFIAALIMAFWRSERTQVIDDSHDAAAALDAPPLGSLSIEQRSDTAAAAAFVVTAPDTPHARDHQFIASNLALMGRESEPRVVLVTSPSDNRSKSVVALNLALSGALDHRAVILADVDSAGRLTDLLGADGKCGISDLIARSTDGDVVVGDCVATVDQLPTVDGFRFIPTGTAAGDAARGMIGTPQMAKLLARLLQEADLIVLDGPPLLDAPAGSRLAAETDGVVLVVNRGSRFEDVQRAVGLIHLAKPRFLGYVFDESRHSSRRRLWGRRSASAEGHPAR